MGQFKPMVKMMTTEPSVELKLKKGGSVKAPKKMMNGGVMGALSAAPAPVGARGGMPAAARPAKPSMAARRGAMAGRRMPMMAEGGESKAEHKAEMKAIKGLKSELKSHEGKPASKAHKGLKTGGVMKSPKPGNYKTGGVVMGQAGFKEGGAIAKSGIINTENQGGEYRNTKMHTAKVDTNSAPTGDVKLGNAGGYKKGGAAKKAYATGGAVNDSGHAVAYPKKPASKSVKNNLQSGTFKKGGKVKMAEGGSTDVTSPAEQRMLDKAYRESIGPAKEELDMARNIRSIPGKLFRGAKKMLGMDTTPKAGSVTETEKSVTVTPAKKRGGSVKC
jgi:hypothetical protein